ncbi:hypothetical protein Ami103574_10800 [Aminipila butyrica]|uniref:Flp pilus assembly protein TadB n=1 Tax=Aminipila butyrica TaxID=433296 RepID=A0A858BW09_9FIRM|nr:hypothetical protein [Aminipila butyrica]QIB69777.1 hypothetical protein Ami103574_10800 [Aminipila butyrica]
MLTQVFTAILFIIGIALLFNLKAVGRDRSSSISFKKTEARSKRIKINAEATLNRFEKAVLNIDSLLKKIRKKRSYLYSIMALFFIAGLGIGFICFSVPFLTMTTGLAFVPLTYLFLLFRTQEITREELAELQNTMSIITNSYLASNNILRAVEAYVEERRRYQDGSFQKVTPFEEFVSDCLYISRNVDRNLSLLAAKINNKYFDQWVKNLRLCMENKEMRFALQPVIDAMADEKIMQIESDTQMKKTWTYYLLVVGAMFAVIPTFRMARKEWYLILTHTPMGQIIVFFMIVAALLSAIYVMKINKPIGTM